MALVHLDATGQSERVVDAIRATSADTEDDIRAMQDDEAMTRRALEVLGSRRNDAYEAALAELREDTQSWWADTLARDPDELAEDKEPATADADGLRRFLETEVLSLRASMADRRGSTDAGCILARRTSEVMPTTNSRRR